MVEYQKRGKYPLNGPQRTILFLIADTGAGHRSAANAIRNAISIIAQQQRDEWQTRLAREYESSRSKSTQEGGNETSTGSVPLLVEQAEPVSQEPDSYHIEIIDVFEEYSRFPLREAVKLYGPTIRYNPKLYGQVFRLSNQTRRFLAVQTIATPLIFNGLLRLLTTVQPDIIVSIHPMLNFITVRVLR